MTEAPTTTEALDQLGIQLARICAASVRRRHEPGTVRQALSSALRDLEYAAGRLALDQAEHAHRFSSPPRRAASAPRSARSRTTCPPSRAPCANPNDEEVIMQERSPASNKARIAELEDDIVRLTQLHQEWDAHLGKSTFKKAIVRRNEDGERTFYQPPRVEYTPEGSLRARAANHALSPEERAAAQAQIRGAQETLASLGSQLRNATLALRRLRAGLPETAAVILEKITMPVSRAGMPRGVTVELEDTRGTDPRTAHWGNSDVEEGER